MSCERDLWLSIDRDLTSLKPRSLSIMHLVGEVQRYNVLEYVLNIMPPRKKAKKTQDAGHEETEEDDEQADDHQDSADTTLSQENEDGSLKDSIVYSTIPFEPKTMCCELQGNPKAPPALVFTHGAGGGIDSPACRDFARGFGQSSPIASFQGSMNLKNRVKAFHTVLEHERSKSDQIDFALGGRSMGARAAVLATLELSSEERETPAALVLISYPLMAGSQGEKREPERREQILLDWPEGVDVLFMIGSEDKMCDLKMLRDLKKNMKARSWICVVRGADHGMTCRPKKAARGVRERTGEVAARWLRGREEEKKWCEISWDGEGELMTGGEWSAEEED
ncbi:hypothetical protein CLAFUW4_10415 [Fulvia fulva]|uniref:KANL3/Tex30 alpha/beta hydrolase-like domain-containing protein n=1 Tax=Passalora fulva TaxID=5499 RepID=A0A9Q8LFC0_PASFU|nr:uncharacterized protein CLAFUR5_05030 [Fulvia fulva]KAK4616053.1 hypothetical protein CLAFUR4_10419 [Fulvia fulva]KAK4616851.1 hypothetical protein CLAFUR0_10420 [Fulvia fulva]UJO16521.1 hypothetical protein CLAFUR5_05030 [Fulvia fulva]WPV19511.1 hypothetical protein CLAFUW4_10415 [Fulvia fulva]WPV34714.1 hypothetical protein CLAFUW7_10415 [Fulvia fulva]